MGEIMLPKVFDIAQPVAFFPIRHHSPACAHHVQRAIDIYKPDCVLIEGPSDTDPLLSFVAGSTPPIAIYYSYQDKEDQSKDGQDKQSSHTCYYPLQSFSPEYVAIQAALAKNVPVHFIDLPLGNLVQDQRQRIQEHLQKLQQVEQANERDLNETGRDEVPRPTSNQHHDQTDENPHVDDSIVAQKSWYDDYYLQRSKYIQALCEKENCRGHNELWEKLFEMPALELSTEQFIANMLAFCYYSRVGYPQELEILEQNHIREKYMAENIQKYRKIYDRTLVITGGFHTSVLMEQIYPEMFTTATTATHDSKQSNTPPGKTKPPPKTKPIKKTKPLPGQAYLIPYSYEECDQLTGYASGMPHPSYYQDMYRRLINGEDDFIRKTTLSYIARLAKALRKNRENVSISEEAAAFAMCLGLADLRDKPQPGVYEFLDGVQSAFVKGELNMSTSFIMTEAEQQLRGQKIGAVAKNAPVPPVVIDFLATAKFFRMNTTTSSPKTITLDIVSNPRHRQQSIFLHRLAFTGNSYARKTYGPDYENRTGTKLVREKWDYAYTPFVTSALIEKSHLGGTISDVCESMLADIIKNHCNSSAAAADILLKAGLMAMLGSDRLIKLLAENIGKDNSFTSLAKCIQSLTFLQGIEHILRIGHRGAIAQAKQEAVMRIIPMIPSLTAADEKEDYSLAQNLKMLYQVSGYTNGSAVSATGMSTGTTEGHIIDTDVKEAYQDALIDFTQRANIPPTLDGTATGLLYNAGVFSIKDVSRQTYAYLGATGGLLAMVGRFLRGIFLTAKDIIFYDQSFLEGLNTAIGNISYEDFLELLPDLRLAFTFFTPREIDTIGKAVLKVLKLDANESTTGITDLPQLDENQLKIIMAIDQAAKDIILLKEPTHP